MPALPPGEVLPTALLFVAGAVYLAMHYGLRPALLAQRFGQGLSPERAAARGWFLFRVLGGLLLGGAALAFRPWLDIGLGAWSLAWWGLLPLPLLVVVLARQAKSAGHRAMYPQVRLLGRRPGLGWKNALSWAVYLYGYEAFFRGLLLYALVAWLGAWPGIAAMTLVYTLAHLPKRAGECAGCLVMGPVFGLLTLLSGGFAAAFVLHLGIALGNDLLCLRERARRSETQPAEAVPCPV